MNRQVVSTPPAQPTNISASSSESRLSRIEPLSMPSPRLLAPVRPVSSSTVNRASTGPCTRVLSTITASDAAIPIPLSAPRVVPSARSQSPSTMVLIGIVSKSNDLSFDSHTISICDCRTTVGASSLPGVAGLLITTLPIASVRTAILLRAAKSRRYSRIFSSFFDGRGTWLISSKIEKTRAGLRSLIVILCIVNMWFVFCWQCMRAYAAHCMMPLNYILFSESRNISLLITILSL